MNLTDLILIALFVEAIVNALKPLWDKTAGKITIAEIVSMAIGVVIAVVAKINFLAGVVDIGEPVLLYVLYTLTGVALGRGPSFVHDLWIKVREQIKT
ncbi:hypothetical protein SDC9_209607 [bioreactor metagenome]|uniref:Uncharacterized protein n=1 Tax=bioreactor metagenome TaxID=1076179 RepID=A0A645JF93_9ZZZZ